MKRLAALSILALLPLLSVGCANPLFTVTERGQIRHVVVVWLKPGANADAVIRSAETLRSVPGVVDISVGKKIASDRPVVDSSYDLMLVFTFENEAAMRAYDQSPQHKQVVETVIKPNVAKFVVYDSTIEDYKVGEQVEQDLKEFRRDAYKKQQDIVDRRS